MNRILQLDPSQTSGKTKQQLDAVQNKLGVVPNLFRVLANSPAALDGYLNFSGALANGTLNARVREQIALAVAESNLCGYCLSAHTLLGGKAGLNSEEILNARRATAPSDKIDAILKLARNIVVSRGELSDADLQAARSSGVSDGEIVEVVANVAVNILTNYLNHVARTVVDFPEVLPGATEASKEACDTGCGCKS